MTVEVTERNLKIEVPSTWEEMPIKTVHYCLQQAHKMLMQQITEAQFCVHCFYKIANIQRSAKSIFLEKIKGQNWLLEKQANTYLLAKQATTFMFKTDAKSQTKEFNYDTVVNFFKTFKLKGKFWAGPDDLLTDISFAEFRTALEELNLYLENKEEKQLSRMLAVLYRPLKNKVKLVFSRESIGTHAKKLDKLPTWQRMAMLLHFTYCIHHIKSEDLLIEGNEINFSVLFPKPKADEEAKKTGTGWTGVLFGIAEKGIFGDIKKTDEANLFDVLLLLYDNYLQAQEVKKAYQK